MPARFVTTSLVTKRAGIAARFVTLVTKRAATRVTVGDSGLCCCTCVTYFER